MTQSDVDEAVEASEVVEPAQPTKPKRVSFAHRLWTGEISYDFVGHSRWWYTLSGVLILISVVSLLVGGLHLGIEFTGGSNYKVNVPEGATKVLDDYRVAVIESGVSNMDGTTVTAIGTSRISIETRTLTAEEQGVVCDAIAKVAGVSCVDSEAVDYKQIGGSWGKQVTQQAGIALGVFLLLVSALMAVYFRNLKMSLAAITALVHDMIITVGVYSLVGFTVTPAALTGLLTILGYSLYDNVVVFDKVRENTANLEDYKASYPELANLSVNQVLVRSINTTVIGVLPVAAILFAGAFILGSGPLEDIGLALFVGMIIGAYSSIFLATPLLVRLRMMEPEMKLHSQRVEKRRQKLAKAAASSSTLDEDEINSATYTIEKSSSPTAASEMTRVQPVRASRAQRLKEG